MRHPSLAFDYALSSTGEDRDVFAFDKITTRHFDVDGRLHVELCNISKANVCPYFGREIPNYQQLGLDANQVYKLYRHPEELAKAAATFRNLQLLLVHTAVSANNPKTDVTVGTIGSDTVFDPPYLKASLAVWTGEAIGLIQSKQQAQLSSSYRYRADMTPGVTTDGVAFDGVMRDIMGNHVALVKEGRAGPDVYVSDSQPLELSKMSIKRNVLVASALAALGIAASITGEQRLALDAAMDKELKAAEDEAEAERKRKEAAEDGTSPAAPVGGKKLEAGGAMDSAAVATIVDAALLTKDFISKAEATTLAQDAATVAVKRVNALHKARKDVESIVGVVALDSAEEVYKYALEKSNVALDGVPAAAYGALVDQVVQRKSVSTITKPTKVALAADASVNVHNAIPGLARINVA